jgi:hypothetical protein
MLEEGTCWAVLEGTRPHETSPKFNRTLRPRAGRFTTRDHDHVWDVTMGDRYQLAPIEDVSVVRRGALLAL